MSLTYGFLRIHFAWEFCFQFFQLSCKISWGARRSSRRAKGRIQKLEVAKTTGDQILSNQKTDDAVREPPKAAVREPLSEVWSFLDCLNLVL